MSLSSGALLLAPVVDPVCSDWIGDRTFLIWAEDVPIGVMQHTIESHAYSPVYYYFSNEHFNAADLVLDLLL